jgi:hypothetical protein
MSRLCLTHSGLKILKLEVLNFFVTVLRPYPGAGCVGWRPGFDPRPCLGFVVHKLALIQIFPRTLRFSRLGYNSAIFLTFRGPCIVSIFQYIQQDAMLHSLFISVNCSTCFGWYLRPSSGAHTTVTTVFGTCQTVTATCRYAL